MGWRSYWKDRIREAWHASIDYAHEQAPWDMVVIPSGAAIGVILGWLLPGGSWEKVLIGFGAAVVSLAGAVLLLFAWNVMWAPVNHARRLGIAREQEDTRRQHILGQFDHLYKYGNLLKDMLSIAVVQNDELQLSRWRILGLEWERFLRDHATCSLSPFEAQRLWSDAGLTVQGLPGASDEVNKYHRRMDAVLQRLEHLIERKPWMADHG
jgi:hypothetical protein